MDELIRFEVDPCQFGRWFSANRTKPFGMEPLDEVSYRGNHHRFRASGTASDRPRRPVKGGDDPLYSSSSNGKIRSEEAGLFFASMSDFGLFLTQGEFEVLTEEGCQFLFHLLGQTVRPRNTQKPIVGVSEVFYANIGRVIDHDCRDTS